MAFEFEAIASLVKCPGCGATLIPAENALICANPEHRFSFPILDGIPLLLAEEAQELSTEEWTAMTSSSTHQQD
ncbi:MAG: Trm112 family protein [Planctomycetaceae bacterium]|nr:Trm112 family protein [Planctomycetaceae bacterium]